MTVWGPWIEHDGAEWVDVPHLARIQIEFRDDGLRRPGEGELIGSAAPNWFWRWKRVRTGWFGTERRRVCDDPAYSPILRYRIRKPSALTLLERIAADPQPIPGEPVPA